jgi:hypothetical protein
MLGDIADQVYKAIEEGKKCAVALRNAQDFAENAHDMLAVHLRGSAGMESDVEQTLDQFYNTKTGADDLTKVIEVALQHLDTVIKNIIGEGTPPASTDSEDAPTNATNTAKKPPAAQSQARPKRPAQPVRPVPPERIKAIRNSLPPPVIPRTGQRTVGQWIGPDGHAEPIQSGWDEKSDLVQDQLARLGLPEGTTRKGDVEMKLAAYMVAKGITHAEVVINNVPCKVENGCAKLVPVLLPEGSSLTVHGTDQKGNPTYVRFTGGSKPPWL